MKIIKINEKDIDIKLIKEASKVIKNGGIVAFPTETVYGLGANALSGEAVSKIFKLKKRPKYDPLIVHIGDKKDIYKYTVNVKEKVFQLIDKFWPGPLTIILKKSKLIPGIVTSDLPTVAIRMPNNKIALKLIQLSDCPVAAPSANLFSRPSSTDIEHIKSDFGSKIDLVIDGGRSKIGIESTVLDMSGEKPLILRHGAILEKDLETVLGKNFNLKTKEIVHNKEKEINHKILSPGMLKKHYSPVAKLFIFSNKLINKNFKNSINNSRFHIKHGMTNVRSFLRKQESNLKFRNFKVVKSLINQATTKNKIVVAQFIEPNLNLTDLKKIILNLKKNNKKVGLMITRESRNLFSNFDYKIMGSRNNYFQIAKNLFSTLRKFDTEKYDYIFVEAIERNKLGKAIMERLEKAGKWIK